MENTVSFSNVFRILKKTWWRILIIMLIAVIVTGAITAFLIPKKYASSTEFYIVNINESIDYTTSSTLAADNLLVQNYIDIIKGDEILGEVARVLYEEDNISLSPKTIRGMISTSSSTTGSIFTITITDTSPERAFKIASRLTQVAPPLLTEITKPSEMSADVSLKSIANTLKDKYPTQYGAIADEILRELAEKDQTIIVEGTFNRRECIRATRFPTQNPTPVSPKLAQNCLLAAFFAAVVAFVVYLLISIFSSVIRTEEDIKQMINLPLIGSIPKWEVSPAKNGDGVDSKQS